MLQIDQTAQAFSVCLSISHTHANDVPAGELQRACKVQASGRQSKTCCSSGKADQATSSIAEQLKAPAPGGRVPLGLRCILCGRFHGIVPATVLGLA